MFRVSCIQLRSNNNIHFNLDKTSKLIKKAVKQKTDFIITPEVSSHFSLNKKELLKICTSMQNDIYLNGIKKLAKKYKKWILIGSLIIKISKNKLVNRSVLIDKSGKIRLFYDKIHMYDVELSKKEKYFESKIFSAGKTEIESERVFKEGLFENFFLKSEKGKDYHCTFRGERGVIEFVKQYFMPKKIASENVANAVESPLYKAIRLCDYECVGREVNKFHTMEEALDWEKKLIKNREK